MNEGQVVPEIEPPKVPTNKPRAPVVPKVVIIVAHQQRIKCILETFISCDQSFYNKKKFRNASMFMLWREGTQVHIKLIYPGEVFRHKETKSPHYWRNDPIALTGIACGDNEQWMFLEEHTRIILVRHGSAEHNEKELSRKEDVPALNQQLEDIGFDAKKMKIETSKDGYNTNLTMFGQLQARRAGIFLKYFLQKCFAQYALQQGQEWVSRIQFTVCASMLIRTQQTAAILLRWAGIPGCVPIHIIPCLHELARGCDGEPMSVFTRLSKENLLNPAENATFVTSIRKVEIDDDVVYRRVESNGVEYPVKISSQLVPFLPKLTFPHTRRHCQHVPFLSTVALVLEQYKDQLEATLSQDEFQRVNRSEKLDVFPGELFEIAHPEIDATKHPSVLLEPPPLMNAVPLAPVPLTPVPSAPVPSAPVPSAPVPSAPVLRKIAFTASNSPRQGYGIQQAHHDYTNPPEGGTRKKRKRNTKRKRLRKRQTRK